MNHPTSAKDAEFTQAHAPYPYQNDEIDLGELIKKIWATRATVVLAVLVVAGVYIAFIAFSYTSKAGYVRYSQSFDLTFEGLDKGEFPNGTPFVMSEIVSPVVLNAVYREYNLESQGLKLDDFRRAISIEPYSPETPFIKQRYERQLGSNLSAAETAELQANMQQALEQAQQGSVRIALTFEKNALPAALAQQVLLDIAQTWAERAIKNQGVLELNIPLYTAKIFDEARFNNLDYLIGIELLLENIGLVESNIEALKAQPAAANVVDAETGFNLEDLLKTIQDVKQYDLRQLMDPVKELGLTRHREVVELYSNRQLSELTLDKSFWEQRSELAGKVLQGFKSAGGSSSNLTGGIVATPQLGDAFLDRLVSLFKESGEQEFRQGLTQKILEYQNKALAIDQRIEEIRLVLTALSSNSGDAAKLRNVYLEQVQTALPKVLKQLREYTEVISRLHTQLGKQAAGSASEIIAPQGGTFFVAEATPVTKKNVLILIALSVGVAFMAMLFCLMLQIAFKDYSPVQIVPRKPLIHPVSAGLL